MSSRLEVSGSIPAIIWNNEGVYEGNLIHYFKAIWNHAQNLNNPYHNYRHMTHVMWLCHDAARYYRMQPRQARDLVIGALFHDFDHTGKAGPDRVNIDRALEGFTRHTHRLDRGNSALNIIDIIEATEYPHQESSFSSSLVAKIIRDADLAQGLDPAWTQQVVLGLAAEWGKTPLEVLKMQIPFYQNLEFKTEWARQRFPQEAISDKINECEEMLLLLSQP